MDVFPYYFFFFFFFHFFFLFVLFTICLICWSFCRQGQTGVAEIFSLVFIKLIVSCSEPHQYHLLGSWRKVAVVSFFQLLAECPDKTPFFRRSIIWFRFSTSPILPAHQPPRFHGCRSGLRSTARLSFLHLDTSYRALERLEHFKGLEDW